MICSYAVSQILGCTQWTISVQSLTLHRSLLTHVCFPSNGILRICTDDSYSSFLSISLAFSQSVEVTRLLNLLWTAMVYFLDTLLSCPEQLQTHFLTHVTLSRNWEGCCSYKDELDTVCWPSCIWWASRRCASLFSVFVSLIPFWAVFHNLITFFLHCTGAGKFFTELALNFSDIRRLLL